MERDSAPFSFQAGGQKESFIGLKYEKAQRGFSSTEKGSVPFGPSERRHDPGAQTESSVRKRYNDYPTYWGRTKH